MALYSIADVTPNSVTVALASTPTPAAWVQIVSTGTTVRVGGPTTDATHGIPMANGAGMLLPTLGNANAYDLSKIYAYATVSDKVSVVYYRD